MRVNIDRVSTTNRKIIDMQNLPLSELEVIGRYSYTKPSQKLLYEVFPLRYEIIYLEKGRQKYIVEDKILTLHGGDLLIIKPGEGHSTGNFFEERGRLYWIIGNTEFTSFFGYTNTVGKSIVDSILGIKSYIIMPANKLFKKILRSIFITYDTLEQTTIEKEKHLYKAKFINELFSLFLELRKICKEQPCQKQLDIRIKKAISFINKNIKEQLDLQPIAYNIACMSLPHFKRLFKEHIGIPPGEFINVKKIFASKILLKLGSSITDTAFELGFSSSQYFATVFQKIVGLSPSQYKKQYQN